MRIQTNIILILIFVTSLFSCKKKYDKDFMGPQVKEEIKFELVDSLRTNGGFIANFSVTNTVPFFFKAKFDKSITWKLTITGDTSGATKTFIGTSSQIDSMTATWKGEQDSLYYFTRETCKVTLSDYYPVPDKNLNTTLSQNSMVVEPTIQLTTSISISITNPKPLPANAVAIFEIKRTNGRRAPYGLAYDSEQCKPNFENVEASPDVFLNGEVTCLSKDYLPLSKNGGPIQRFYKPSAALAPINSPYYFKLKGTDSYNNDYYIGRVELFRSSGSYNDFLTTNKNVKPQDLWFNVFVYGTGDGAKINYTIKEDDDEDGQFNQGRTRDCGYTPADVARLILEDETTQKRGIMDDAFQYGISLNFKGWKLFSIPYIKFGQVAIDGVNSNGKGKHNPDKIYAIQFSLVAPDKGKAGEAIFDYPVITIGGPLKY
jgi:hypothetical protein